MTLQVRQRLYIATIIIFLVIAPIVIALAIGVRFDSASGVFVRTGGIYIKTIPSDVAVSLNSEFSTKSPHKFMYLFPSLYSVQLDKSGFAKVTTDMNVYPDTITRINGLELFPLAPEQRLELSGVQHIFSSPFSGHVFIVRRVEDEFHLYLWSDSQIQNGIQVDQSIDRVKWNPAQNEILLFGEQTLYYADLASGKIVGPIHSVEDASFSSPQGHVIVSISDKKYLISIADASVLRIEQSTPYVISRQGSTLSVQQNKSRDQIIFTTSNGASDMLQSVSRVSDVTLLDDIHVLIKTDDGDFIFNFSTKILARLSINIRHWVIQNNIFYYANDFEIWSLDLSSQEQIFINRFGAPISFFSISPRDSALVLPSKDTINFWYTITQHPTEVRVPLMSNGNIAAMQRHSLSSYAVFILTEENTLLIQIFRQ